MGLLARIVRRFPRTLVALTLIVTVVMGLSAAKITRTASLEENIPRSNKRLAAYLDFRTKYEGGNSVVIVLTGRDIFEGAALRTIERITATLESMEGVTRVVSMTNATEFQGTPDGIAPVPVVSGIPVSRDQSLALKAKVLADPWYNGRLVASDGRATIIVATLDDLGTMGANAALLHKVQSTVEKNRGNLTADFAGSTVMQEQIDRFLTKDLQFLFPVVLVCIVVILLLTFRSLRGVLLPLLTVLMSAVWTIGLMAWLGRPLSLIGNILPVLLIAVGSAYGIHIVSRFQEALAAGEDRGQAVETAVRSTGFSVWMAALTTMAGFGSLALSKMKMIVDFGVFSAFGTLAAFVVSITFIPALLALLPARVKQRRVEATKTGEGDRTASHGRLEHILSGMQAATLRHRLVVLAAVSVLLVLALLGWPRIVASFNPSEFLPEGSPHRHTEALVDARFGGSAELNVLVQGDLNDPVLLAKIATFQRRMEKLGTGRTMSLADLLARMNRAFHGGDPAYEILPSDSALIPQYMFLLTMSTAPGELSQFMTIDQREARISGRISNVMSTSERSRLLKELEAEARAVFGAQTRVSITGTPVLEFTMMDLIRDEQIVNIFSSLLAVLLLVAVAFRSIRAGLACLAPIAVTIVMVFGLMGWTGIPLNTATAVIASLAAGIGVDYGIHFYRRYVEECARSRTSAAAFIETARTVGVPIIANALAVGAGFAALLLSNLSLFRSFGGLIALAMVLTAAGALIVLPVLLSFKSKPFRDTRAQMGEGKAPGKSES